MMTPTWRQLLRTWSVIGLKSFGGGQSVQLYAHREFVQQRQWLSAASWSETYAVCRLAPGINVIAFTLVTGWRLAGVAGAGASVVGLLLPSATVTVLITAGYNEVAGVAVVRSAFEGLIAAAAGLSVAFGWRVFEPIAVAARAEGYVMLGVVVSVLLGSGVLVVIGPIPVFAVLMGAGATLAAVTWQHQRRQGSATD